MLIDFLAGCLATWAIAALMYYEYGPGDVCVRFRQWIGQRSRFWNEQLGCFWCCTRWAALLVFVFYLVSPVILYPLAFSGAAILLTHGGRVIQKEMQDNG